MSKHVQLFLKAILIVGALLLIALLLALIITSRQTTEQALVDEKQQIVDQMNTLTEQNPPTDEDRVDVLNNIN